MAKTSTNFILKMFLFMGDAGASTTKNGNSIIIMKNLESGGFETLEAPNIFLYPSILSLTLF